MNDRVERAAKLLRIWQTWLGASREQCDEVEEELWDQIEETCAAIEQLVGGGEAEPWAYGIPDSAITGSRGPLMQVILEIPKDAQYPELLIPLYPIPPATVPQSEHDALKAEYDKALARVLRLEMAAKRYRAAVRELFKPHIGKKLMVECSPTDDAETYDGFMELNNAGRALTAAIEQEEFQHESAQSNS